MKRLATALGSGLLFGAGLCLSGMIDPRKVIGFLDVTGHWDPSLAAVMVGAIGVHATLLRLLRRRAVPGETSTAAAPRRRIDRALIGGSILFGVGWGISGYCPGPAIVSLGLGAPRALGFVAAMIVGAWLAALLTAPRAAVAAPAEARPSN
jgi:uncharacterized membrane protein YedE/YeeE